MYIYKWVPTNIYAYVLRAQRQTQAGARTHTSAHVDVDKHMCVWMFGDVFTHAYVDMDMYMCARIR